MRKITVVLTMVFMLVAGPAAAQTFGFGVHAGVSLPMGDYGDDDNQDGGFAELGFAGGVDLFYPLGMAPGLSWLTSASAVAHSVDDEAFNQFGIEVDGGYLMFPLMTGLRFDIPAGPLGLFAQGQLGAVFAKGPTFDFVGGGSTESDFTTKFGFNLGGGVQVNQNIYVGARYFPLGDVDFDYETETVSQNISFLDILVGFAVR